MEVVADDVRMALASAEEPGGTSGEFSLVSGPVALGQAVLEIGVDQVVGVELGRARGRKRSSISSA